MKTRLWFSSSCSRCSSSWIVFITYTLLSFLGYALELEQKELSLDEDADNNHC